MTKGGLIRPLRPNDDWIPAILSPGYVPEAIRNAFPDEVLKAIMKTTLATQEPATPQRRTLLTAIRDLLNRARRLR